VKIVWPYLFLRKSIIKIWRSPAKICAIFLFDIESYAIHQSNSSPGQRSLDSLSRQHEGRERTGVTRAVHRVVSPLELSALSVVLPRHTAEPIVLR
jgi:hypothetical protein